jgi:hypothetical protein
MNRMTCSKVNDACQLTKLGEAIFGVSRRSPEFASEASGFGLGRGRSPRRALRTISVCFVAWGLASALAWPQQPAARPGGANSGAIGKLGITVIDGDDGANILKGKTSVKPVVEVRDAWNLPIAGALVTFTLPSGHPSATFHNRKKETSVITDAHGRAVADDMRPAGKGVFKITIHAFYQDESASLTIQQTNFKTAAEAQKTVRLPAYANAMSGGGKALVAVGAAGAAAAGVALALAHKSSNSPPDCSSLFNQFNSELNTAITLPIGSTQWVAANQTMFNDLGAYCSCAGGPGLLTSNPTVSQDLQNLLSAGSGAGFAVPSSCGSF